jgi:hypothetical protein
MLGVNEMENQELVEVDQVDQMEKVKKVKRVKMYSQIGFWRKFFKFFRLLIQDIINVIKYGRPFSEYGLTLYCGKQGRGKTVALVEYLERMRVKYPKAIIVTNFGYVHQTQTMTDWRDFYTIRNGVDGVIFAIDEIQNEYNSSAWKDFPEDLLTEITQQRKQRVKIVATSQVYTRVVKQLREQAAEVIECRTLAGRWTFLRCFDAEDYDMVVNSQSTDKKMKMRRKWRKSFVQDAKLRDLFDTYEKVKRMQKTQFIPRHERGLVEK